MRVRDALPKPVVVAGTQPATTMTPVIERPQPVLDPEAQEVLDLLRAAQAHDATKATSPIPNNVEPTRARQTTQRGAERGPER